MKPQTALGATYMATNMHAGVTNKMSFSNATWVVVQGAFRDQCPRAKGKGKSAPGKVQCTVKVWGLIGCL